jgi:hypothetical protein
VLKRQQDDVSNARAQLGRSLDEIERRLMPGNLGKVASWWVRRESKKHPIPFAIGGVALGGLIIGLLSWAAVSDDD